MQKEADNQERHELAEQAAAEAIKDGFDSNKPKTPPARIDLEEAESKQLLEELPIERLHNIAYDQEE